MKWIELMSERIFNFSAGPATLPLSVLEEAQRGLISLNETGIGILEHSHRGKAFIAVYEETMALCRQIANVSDDYSILFLQGGASSQFHMVPMNFLSADRTADYLHTGSWSKKAIAEAKRFGNVHVAGSSEDRNFCYIPIERSFSDDAAYVHYTSNNTICGTQYVSPPDVPDGSTLICDASSDIFSRPIDVSRHGMIYCGAQKNLGPSGVVLVIVRNDILERGNTDLPSMLQYKKHADNDSALNTPPTFAIYMMGLVFKWILAQGGLESVEQRNIEKAGKLYDFLNESSLFNATADEGSSSLMNVTFVTGNADLDAEFIALAADNGMSGLKGHRSVGGMRASIYNAFPTEGVDALVNLMKDFETKHA